MLLLDARGEGDAVAAGQIEIEQQQVGRRLRQQLLHQRAVAGIGDNIEIRCLRQQGPQSFPDQGVVFRDDDFCHGADKRNEF